MIHETRPNRSTDSTIPESAAPSRGQIPGALRRRIRLAGLAVLILGAMLGTAGTRIQPARAQQAVAGGIHGAAAATLSLASAGFGPVAVNAIVDPGTLERIARELRDQRWKLPTQGESWPMEDGVPQVAMPRVDELWHTIEPGQSLPRLRAMFRMNTAGLMALNPGVDLNALEPGQRIRTWKRDPEALSQSVGAPNAGRLVRGEPLPDSPNYRILYPHRTFGTYYTVSEVWRVLDNFYQNYPHATKLVIGDISYQNGRKIHPHASHRSGRDIDISYPQVTRPQNTRRFHRVHRGNLDVEQTLAIVKDFLDGGHVQYIFMDRWIQRELRAEALRQGASREWVERVFQYPAYSGTNAIIRFSPGHKNHLHVRFHCQQTDRRCH